MNTVDHVKKSAMAVWIAFALIMTLSGCATARLNQFRNFSQAGVAYTRASRTLTNEAGDAAIRADSAVLLKARTDLPAAERRSAVLGSDQLLKQRLVILHQLNSHAQLLESYFQIIADMVESRSGNGLGESARGLYDSMATMSKPLQNATIGKEKIADYIPAVLNIVVQKIKVKALNAELKVRAPLIERELALQEAALTALAKDMRDDLAIKLNVDESREVIDPYGSSADRLPADWAARRERVLTSHVAVQSATDAAKAAKALRTTFAALVAGNLSSGAIGNLIQEINSMLDLADQIKGEAK